MMGTRRGEGQGQAAATPLSPDMVDRGRAVERLEEYHPALDLGFVSD